MVGEENERMDLQAIAGLGSAKDAKDDLAHQRAWAHEQQGVERSHGDLDEVAGLEVT